MRGNANSAKHPLPEYGNKKNNGVIPAIEITPFHIIFSSLCLK